MRHHSPDCRNFGRSARSVHAAELICYFYGYVTANDYKTDGDYGYNDLTRETVF